MECACEAQYNLHEVLYLTIKSILFGMMCATQKCLILNVSAPHLLVRYVAITHGVLGDAGSVGQ